MKFPFEIKTDREFDVAGFGTNAVDFLITLPRYPEFNSKLELTEYEQLAGGEIATTVSGLQRLGLKTTYSGRFGDDNAGDFGWKTLVDEGVDMEFSERIEGARTQIAFIFIDERSGERTVIWKRDESLGFTSAEGLEEMVKSSSVIHFTPHDTAACIELAKIAKECGTIVSIDVDRWFKGMDELLHLVDIFMMSHDFCVAFGDGEEDEERLKGFASTYGSGIVGVTLGEEGSMLLCNEEVITSKGFEVPGGCKDTTGAGDSFRAGLLYGMVNGMSIEESCRRANAVAALKCRAVGARTALPTETELEEFLYGK